MRFAVVLLLAISAGVSAQPLVWEKYLAPGLVYRMEVDPSLPRVLHGLRYSQGSIEVRAEPEVGEQRVFSTNGAGGRQTVSALVAQTRALAGINADFFAASGNPLGMTVRARELISTPFTNRSVFAWGPDYAGTGTVEARYVLQRYGEPDQEIVVNREAGEGDLVLYTPAAGTTFARKAQPLHAVFRVLEGAPSPDGSITAEFSHVVVEQPFFPIPEGHVVLTGTGPKRQAIQALYRHERVVFRLRSRGLPWDRVEHVVAGGPNLLTNGQVAVDAARQGFNAAFSSARHPRTAVGRTRHGDIWFVVVDGRSSHSVGATLPEMAALMARLGCVDAINLDGGGSTTMNILGVTVNRPSDGNERAVANAVLLYGPHPAREPITLEIDAPEGMSPGEVRDLTVRTESGVAIAPSEIVWSARGAGWIDQGGRLRATEEGLVTVRAAVRGHLLAQQVRVIPASRRGGRGSATAAPHLASPEAPRAAWARP